MSLNTSYVLTREPFSCCYRTFDELPEPFRSWQRNQPVGQLDCDNQNNNSQVEVLKDKGPCTVCGEKAFYYFYGTLSCDSCRTFFRRQVLQNKELSCHFGNGCQVNSRTRKECSKCRLNKCFEAGMRIELVAPNEEQRIRRGRSFDYDKLATRTRQIRTAETGHSKDDDDIQIVETIIVNSPKAAPSPQWADSQRKTLVTRTDLIGHHEPPSCSTMTTPPSTGHWPLIPGQLLLNSSLIGSELTDRLPWINSKTKWLPGNQLPVADGLGLPLPIPPKATEPNVVDPNDKKAPCPVINCHQVKRPSSIYSHTECTNTTVPPAFEQESLSDCDDQLPALNEETIETYLRNKFTRRLDSDPLKMTIGGCGHCSTSATSSVNGAMMEEISEMAEAMLPRPIRIADSKHELVMAAKLLYFGIERIVRACQVLTPFRMMTDPDQGALLRGGVSEMLLLRSVYHFDFGASCWEFASKRNSGHMTSTRLDLLVLKQINDVMFTNYLNFVTLIGDKWRKNNVVLSMLTAIVLFSPNRSDLIDREAVRASQRCYCHLLKRYLASVEGSQRASVTYHKLMVSLDQLKLLRDDYESATFNLTETEVSLLHSCFCGLSI